MCCDLPRDIWTAVWVSKHHYAAKTSRRWKKRGQLQLFFFHLQAVLTIGSLQVMRSKLWKQGCSLSLSSCFLAYKGWFCSVLCVLENFRVVRYRFIAVSRFRWNVSPKVTLLWHLCIRKFFLGLIYLIAFDMARTLRSCGKLPPQFVEFEKMVGLMIVKMPRECENGRKVLGIV